MDVLQAMQRHKAMCGNKGSDTQPEVKLRKALWHRGFRYRKNWRKLVGCPDIVLTRQKIVIFVDGDFGHARGQQYNLSWREKMPIEQLQLKLQDYHRAMERLRVAVNSKPDANGIYFDATIQRFEFCFELAWKLMKAMLDYEGIEVSSPRDSIREGWKQSMIDNAEDWLYMSEQRNICPHAYSESIAWDIYEKICNKYIDLLTNFEQEATKRINLHRDSR